MRAGLLAAASAAQVVEAQARAEERRRTFRVMETPMLHRLLPLLLVLTVLVLIVQLASCATPTTPSLLPPPVEPAVDSALLQVARQASAPDCAARRPVSGVTRFYERQRLRLTSPWSPASLASALCTTR